MFERSTSCGKGGWGVLASAERRGERKKSSPKLCFIARLYCWWDNRRKMWRLQRVARFPRESVFFSQWQRFSFTREKEWEVKTAHSKVTWRYFTSLKLFSKLRGRISITKDVKPGRKMKTNSKLRLSSPSKSELRRSRKLRHGSEHERAETFLSKS